MITFKELHLDSNIYKAINECGYTTPTPVQAQSIPHILAGKDLVASAQTGTGKTAAFVLPALHRLSVAEPSKKTRVLILTPTRELANQITTAASTYGKFLDFNIVNLVGGMPYHQQIRELARGADIIVATPGRLLDHIEQKRVSLSHVEMLVLDEADRMLDMGFIDDVQYIAKLTPQDRQTLLFSATVDKQLTTVVKHLLKNPVRVDLSTEKITAPQIEQHFYKTTNASYKSRLLQHLLQSDNIFKAIIFSATKINADKLKDYLRDHGQAAAALHGDLKQNARNRTLEQFRRGKIQYLVATDVAARGIDVSDITHVFNYDLPKFCEDYVHRIGRTGRAGKTGIAISFVSPTDAHHLKRIERYIGQRLQVSQYPEFKDAPRVAREEYPAAEEREHKPFSKDRRREKSRDEFKPFAKEGKGKGSRFADTKRDDFKPFGKKRKEAAFSEKERGEFKPFQKKHRKESPFAKDHKESRSADRERKEYKPFERDRKEGRSADREPKEYKPFERSRKEGRSADREPREYKPFERSRKEGRSADREPREYKPFERSRKEGRSADREPREYKPFERSRKEGRSADREPKEYKPFERDRKEGRSADRDPKEYKPFGKARKKFKEKPSAKGHGPAKAADGSKPRHASKQPPRAFGGSKKKHVFHSRGERQA